MASSLNAGFSNNINIMELRSSATSLHRVTDRDINNAVSAGTWPPSPPGAARTIIDSVFETDGGVNNDKILVTEFTIGVD